MTRPGAVVFGMLLFITGCEENYSNLTVRKTRQLLGDSFKDYRFISYPTNNFGLGTAYQLEGDRVTDAQFLCDPADCFGLTLADRSSWLALGGLAAVGGDGPPITLSENEERSFSAQVVLPEVLKMLNFAAGTASSKGVKTRVGLGRAYPRKLRRQAALDALSRMAPEKLVRKAFSAGTLVLVVADVVSDGLDVSLCVDASVNPSLHARLSEQVTKVIGSEVSLKVEAAERSSGCFTLQATQPVIVATLQRRQPSAGTLQSAGESWDDWTVVETPIRRGR